MLFLWSFPKYLVNPYLKRNYLKLGNKEWGTACSVSVTHTVALTSLPKGCLNL